MIRLSFCLLLLFLVYSCAPIKVTDATVQPWSAGVKGGGTGKNYVISIEVKKDGILQFEDFYFRKQNIDFVMSGLSSDTVTKGQKLNLTAFYRMDEDGRLIKNGKKYTSVKKKAQAIIRYKFNENEMFLGIDEFESKGMILYP